MAKRRIAQENDKRKTRQEPRADSGSNSGEGVQMGNGNDGLQVQQEREKSGRVDTPVKGAEFSARIARKAFELYERRGGRSGSDVEDWLEAERLVRLEIDRESAA